MSLYNMIFGRNPHSELILALIGLKKNDIERYRDCSINFDDEQIWVYTRTGGGNREDYPNELLTKSPYYLRDHDDSFDTTYANYYFKFPDEIKQDIHNLRDIGEHGFSANLIQWVRRTLDREKTESDIYTEKRERHEAVLRELRLNGDVSREFNGHTTVPLTDHGMERILREAESNDGEFLGSAFGVKPYQIVVQTDVVDKLYGYRKVVIDTNWNIDEERWNYWKEKYGEKYPKAIAEIKSKVER